MRRRYYVNHARFGLNESSFTPSKSAAMEPLISKNSNWHCDVIVTCPPVDCVTSVTGVAAPKQTLTVRIQLETAQPKIQWNPPLLRRVGDECENCILDSGLILSCAVYGLR